MSVIIHSWGEIPLPPSALNNGTEKRRQLEHSVVAVSAGGKTVAFIQKDGKGFFVLQGNDRGKKQKPRTFFLKKDRICRLSCGESHIVLLSQKGKIFQLDCQESPSIPWSPGLSDKEVIQVACGDYHSIALTKDGKVFCWGQNSSGQLGLGMREPSNESPSELETLTETPLALVAAGGDHSFALTITGVVLAWGRNSKGQLGLGDKKNRYCPTPVKSLRQQKIAYISCGKEHTAVLTKGGLVFTFGAGQYGQLGHNSVRDELWPRLVAELWGAEVSQIACGRHHTLAYIPSLKKVYACGRGEQGQLGSGMTRDQYVPLPVQQLGDCHRDHCIEKIIKIIAGGNQSFVLCSTVQTFKNSYICTEDAICTLDDKLISKWISKCDSESWNAIKREISVIFSSASCLNGSFLKQGHQSTPDKLNVDLSLARLSFEKLAKKEKVMNKVESVVMEKLVCSLSSLAAGIEGLGVYLLLPELMRVTTTHESCRDLCFAFAGAVLHLDSHCLVTLEAIWSKLPDTFFKSLVKVFHTVSTRYLHQTRTQMWFHGWDSFEKTLRVLQKLYEVNLRGGRKIDDKNFYIREVSLLFQILISSGNMVLPEYDPLMYVYRLRAYPCILDMDTKCMLFKSYIYTVIQENAGSVIRHNKLFVRRSSVWTDTIQQLQSVSRNYSCPLQVKFAEEDGVDHGGVSQEFFSMVARELHLARPAMFQFCEDSRLIWFTPDVHNSHMFYLGVLYGMALYNFCIMNLQFPLALFKKLMGIPTTLEDLEEVSPIEACGLKNLLEEDDDFVEELYLDFTARGHELVPRGQEIPVTKYNRQKYVDAYVDYVFNTSVQKEFENFSKGFHTGCPNTMWTMFLPEELMAFLTGNINYEWEELRKNAKYILYEPTDENIQNFWSIFFELSEEQKKNFLSFMTGSDRLPVGGLSKLHLKIANANKADPDAYYPVASTCYGILYLPNYSSIDVLREKFLHAITLYEEFGEA